jgi:hypothetical protein
MIEKEREGEDSEKEMIQIRSKKGQQCNGDYGEVLLLARKKRKRRTTQNANRPHNIGTL